MFIRMAVIGLLLMASVAQAKVYRCVDPATGKTTFTDVACAGNQASNDQVRVKPQNFGASGHRSQASAQQRVWRSQDPDRSAQRAGQPMRATSDARNRVTQRQQKQVVLR